jgi:hypothetical protein
VPALIFLLALAVLAVVVWVRVADRDSSANPGASCGSAPQLPANQAVTVTVLNGNGADGLATRVLDTLAGVGFVRGNVGDTDNPFTGVATVTSGPNATASALLVSYFFPGSTVTVDTREDASVTVTVGQKFTGMANLEQVRAAMAKAVVSQTPTAKTSGSTASSSAPASPTPTCFTTPPYPTPTTSASPAAS